MSNPIKPSAREALLEAAVQVLGRNPGASLSEIATRAGVGRATLHRYFSTRDKLVRELALEALRRTDEATTGIEAQATTAKEALQMVLEAVLPLGDRYHFLASESVAITDPEILKESKRQLAELAELAEALKAEGEVAPDIPTAWAVVAIDSLIYAAWSAVEDGQVARREAADLLLRTVLRGLAPLPAKSKT